jgi:hypothetical protein
VTTGAARATHLWRRDREAAWPLAESEAWSSEERGASRSGALLWRSATARAAKR